VRSRAEASEKLDWYAMRWKVETFHKILKFRLQSRRVPASYSRPANEPDRSLLHPELAHILDHHARPLDVTGER
jgi:hypothetical protein